MTLFEKFGYALIGLTCFVILTIDLSARTQRRRQRVRSDPPKERNQIVIERTAMVSVVAVFAGTLVWRIRSATELSDNPADSAALVRVGLDAVAIGLAIVTKFALEQRRARMVAAGEQPAPGTRALSPGRLYLLYIAVVLLGFSTAVKPSLVVFRAFDLLAIAWTVAVAVRVLSLDQVFTLARRILYAMTASIAVSVVLFTSESLTPAVGPIPFRLQGRIPEISYNSVGTFGLFLLALGAGPKKLDKKAIAVGIGLIVLGQYRTGYIAVAVMLLAWLVLRLRAWGVSLAVLLAYPAVLVLSQPIFARAWIRGDQGEQTAELGGRTVFWERAIHVAERSPIIGTGLTSGTRFEVFPELGRNLISTIHSTWVEAYLGTGLIGVGLIVVIFMQALRTAWRLRAVTLVPVLVMASVAVRSITGSTIELAGSTLVLFAMIMFAAWRESQGLMPETSGTVSRRTQSVTV